MRFKLIIAFIENTDTEAVNHAAREAGAAGVTVLHHAQGEGSNKRHTFFGLDLETQRDVVMFVTPDTLSHEVLKAINQVGKLDEQPGKGIAFQLDIEDIVGVRNYLNQIEQEQERW